MTLYRYNGYDAITRRIKDGWAWKDPEVLAETSPGADYTPLDSIEDVYNIGQKYYADYLQWRWAIRDKVYAEDWADLTDAEKDIAIALDIGNNSSDKVAYLMSKGDTLNEAKGKLIQAFSKTHTPTVQSCRERGEHENLYAIVPKYLSQGDSADFFRLIQELWSQYINQAIMGVNDGHAGEGLFDFIESTVGTSFENAGLEQQGFVMQNGDADASNFITELMDWFRLRKYESSI